MARRYFWLKLHRDFFKRHDVMIIESMPNGKDYLLFYLKLLVESIDHEGALRFSDTIPYDENMLATITHTNIDVVRAALKVFEKLQMVELLPDDTLYVQAVESMIGSETDSARWKRAQRKRDETKQLPDNVRTCQDESGKCQTELEKDLEKEKKERHGAHVRLTPTEHQRLVKDFGQTRTAEYIGRVDDYVGSKGKRYKSHYHTIRAWLRKDAIKPRGKGRMCPLCKAEQPFGYTGAMCMACHEEMSE